MTSLPNALEPHALPDAWLRAIDEAAPVLLGPHDRTGPALVTEVARLSELYTRDRGALRTQSAALAARLRFFLPRDLPKVEGPLAELAWAGALPARRRWRVLDLGAGLGTSTLGIATFARRADIEGLDVLAIERDARSLDVMKNLAARCGHGALEPVTVPVQLETRELDLERIDVRALRGPYDLVVIGLALNELWAEHPDALDRRATLLVRASEILADDGALIVIEPALRESARALQAVRDRIAARHGS
ncbi:MAG: class I SAM-dependent methyltransferase, partial [Myxococcota bacterium]|nr:class I SAM-dependent methyltransferase [Myxococcota bacterium]